MRKFQARKVYVHANWLQRWFSLLFSWKGQDLYRLFQIVTSILALWNPSTQTHCCEKAINFSSAPILSAPEFSIPVFLPFVHATWHLERVHVRPENTRGLLFSDRPVWRDVLSSGLALHLLASTRSKSHPKLFIHGVEAKVPWAISAEGWKHSEGEKREMERVRAWDWCLINPLMI